MSHCSMRRGNAAPWRFRWPWAAPASGTSTCRATPAKKFHRHIYWSLSYYEIWMEGLKRLLTERGLLERPPKKLPVFEAANVAPALAKGSPYIRATEAKPLFKIGDRVKVRNLHPEGHTRLPGYLRGKTGEIVLLSQGPCVSRFKFPGRGRKSAASLCRALQGARCLWRGH